MSELTENISKNCYLSVFLIELIILSTKQGVCIFQRKQGYNKK